jgi:hypothetical protein
VTTEDKLQSVGDVVKVLAATIGILNEHVAGQDRRLRTLEAQMAPVLWICPMGSCGAPNETPRVIWALMGVAIPAVCPACQMVIAFTDIAGYGVEG